MSGDYKAVQISDKGIEMELSKHDENWNKDDEWINGGYDTCEKVAFDLKFGKGNYDIVARYDCLEYPHESAVIIKEYTLRSCIYPNRIDNEDTIMSEGPVEAVRMIMDRISDVR